MPRYRLKKDHYLQNNKAKVEPQLHPAGAEIDWNGAPSLQMEPLDKEAKERSGARLADFAEKRKEAQSRRGNARVGWSSQFEQNMANVIMRPELAEDAPAQAAAGSAAKNRRRAA